MRTWFVAGSVLILAVLLVSNVVQSADYIYLPKPVADAEQPQDKDGVLVREVLVKKGDHLARIAKRYTGHDDYYPQILLFNTIKNPRLIYPGDLLRVPVTAHSPKKSAAITKSSRSARGKQKTASPRIALQHQTATPAQTLKTDPVTPILPVTKSDNVAEASEQSSYTSAMMSFRRGDCQQALEGFDRFIAVYPQSAFLPEIILNRAECYMKLSGS